MKLSALKRKELVSHEWCVYTMHELTQNRITEYLHEHGREELSTGEIFYSGEMLPVYLVPFLVAERLATNKHTCGYEYRVFHRNQGEKTWREWREGKKTPAQKVHSLKKKNIVRKAI